MNHAIESPFPSLPQYLNAEQQQARDFELSISKTAYNYMFSYLEPVPISANVPKGEGFTAEYEAKVLKVFLPLLENFKDVVISLMEKELVTDLPSGTIASIKAVEAAYEQLKADKLSHSPLKIVKEVEDLYHLIEALSELPKTIEQAFQHVAQLPGDIVKMVEGFGLVFKEFEKEGFTDGEKEKQIRDLWPTFISRDQATAWIREFRKS